MRRYMLPVILLLCDILSLCISIWFAILLRFAETGASYQIYISRMVVAMPVYLFCHLIFFFGFKLYNRVWKYAGIKEMISIVGANAYGILMIDTDAGNWLHWKTGMVTTAGIPLGYAGADTYVGPYPPAGTTHSYTIYVAALREADANVIGFLDGRNDYADYTPDKLLCSMDVTDGGSAGNVIAVGTITGTYSTAK